MIYADKALANIALVCKELDLTVMSKNKGDSNVVFGVEKLGFPFNIGFNVSNQMYYITLEGGKYKTCPDLDYFKTAVGEHVYARTNLAPNCMLVAELFSGVYGKKFELSAIDVETIEESMCVFVTDEPTLELTVTKHGVLFEAVLCKMSGLKRVRKTLVTFTYKLTEGNIVQCINVDYICHIHKNKTTKASKEEFKVDQWVIKVKEVGDDTYLSTEGLQDVHIDGVTFNINNFDHIENWLLGELEVKEDVKKEMGYEDILEVEAENKNKQKKPQTAKETMDAVNDAVDNVGSMLEKALDTVNSTIKVLKTPTAKPDEVKDAIEQLDEVHEEIEQLQQQEITVEESKQVQEVVTAIEEAKSEVQGETLESTSNIIRDVFAHTDLEIEEPKVELEPSVTPFKTPAEELRAELENLDDVHEKYDMRSKLSKLEVEEPVMPMGTSLDSKEGGEDMKDLVAIYNIKDMNGVVVKVRFEYGKACYDVPVELAKDQGLPVELIIDSLELVNIRGLMMTEKEHHSRVFAKQITDTQATKVLIDSFFN